MKGKPSDMTPPPDLVHEVRVGPARTRIPSYVERVAPCNHACPAGEDIRSWLAAAQAGEFEQAWRVLVRANPLPAVHGRVCYHPCEDSCNRAQLDASVSIHAVERFLGDLAIERDWRLSREVAATGRRVLVVGAGPSGLSAAYHLARLGHEVEVHEAGPVAGGMMHFGIPAYRLPRDVLDTEVRRLRDHLGVRIHLDSKVDDLAALRADGRFDAVFLAVGAHLSRRVDIPARDAGRILDAVTFLRQVDGGAPPQLGRRVAVYGGGNTAMDAARVARRLGASEALIIYRRDRDHMPAHEFEADEAIDEGVKIHWLRTIREIQETTFTVEVMELDETGSPRATGRMETLEVDDLILALGQDVDTAFLQGVPDLEFRRDGSLVVDKHLMTACPGVFAGGDMVPGERSVTVAVGHGKQAARQVDAYLRGRIHRPPAQGTIAAFETLNVWYFTDAARREQPGISRERRESGFDEVWGGFDEAQAVFEAQRCLSCGKCIECDGCLGACAEKAVTKLGPGKGYRIDLDVCTGCGVCSEQCPCGAIAMLEERA